METAATDDVRFAVGAISISHVFALPTFSGEHDRRYGNRRYRWCSFRRRCDFHIARLCCARARSSTTGGMETAATDDVRFAVGAISISHVFALPTFSVKHDRRYGNRRYG